MSFVDENNLVIVNSDEGKYYVVSVHKDFYPGTTNPYWSVSAKILNLNGDFKTFGGKYNFDNKDAAFDKMKSMVKLKTNKFGYLHITPSTFKYQEYLVTSDESLVISNDDMLKRIADFKTKVSYQIFAIKNAKLCLFVDNLGLEDFFDIDMEYLGHEMNPFSSDMINVADKYGKVRVCRKDRLIIQDDDTFKEFVSLLEKVGLIKEETANPYDLDLLSAACLKVFMKNDLDLLAKIGRFLEVK